MAEGAESDFFVYGWAKTKEALFTNIYGCLTDKYYPFIKKIDSSGRLHWQRFFDPERWYQIGSLTLCTIDTRVQSNSVMIYLSKNPTNTASKNLIVTLEYSTGEDINQSEFFDNTAVHATACFEKEGLNFHSTLFDLNSDNYIAFYEYSTA